MSTHRIDRLQEEMRHLVSSILLFEVTDPRVKGVTLTRVLLTKDLSIGRIYYETSATKEERELVQKGLERASGFIRKKVAAQLPLRTLPHFEFYYDETQEELSRVDRLFTQI